jgi:hypothetical protein
MKDQLLSEGLRRLNQAAVELHHLLYVGEEPPFSLRDDLPVNETGDLVGILHDINRAAMQISYATQPTVAEATHG